jgi:hypothetical protein
MTLTNKIELGKGIVSMALSSNQTLLTIDDGGNYREYSLSEHKLLNSLKTNLENSIWNRRVSFSANGEFIVYGVPDNSEINVYSTISKELKYKISKGYHQGDVVSSVTDNFNKYFVSTSKDGRAFLWNIQTGSNVFSFPKLEKPINIARFDPTGEIVALGGDDGIIQLYSISTMKLVQTIKNENPIRAILFLSNKYLISLDKENKVILWRIADSKNIKVIIEHNANITKMTISADEKFLFLSTIKGTVILYNLTDHKIVNFNYININNAITSIITVQETGDLIVSDIKGIISFYSLSEDQKVLNKYIKAKKYQEAYRLILQNDLLKFTKEAEVLELVWKKALQTSKDMLENDGGDLLKIDLLLEPFQVVPEKKEIINTIIADFKHYEVLNRFMEKENYYLAYDTIAKYPSLEKTKAYKRLDSIWQDYFRRAKIKLFEKNGEVEAREMLAKFSGVTDKAYTIKNLFLQKNSYLAFQNLLRTKKFGQLLELVSKNRFLESNSEYQEVINIIDGAYIQMKLAIKNGTLDVAKERADFLRSSGVYLEEVNDSLSEIEIHKQFITISKKKDINEILSMVDKYPYLKNYPIVENLEKHWNEVIFEAQEIASHGDVEGVANLLSEFYLIKVRFNKMANIFKIAYLSDLHNTVAENSDHLVIVSVILKRGVENYLKLFGLDQEIEDLIGEIRKKGVDNIDLTTIEIGKINQWTPEKIKNSIIE